MILVLPFCKKDGFSAVDLLKWIVELDDHNPCELILSYDDETPPCFAEECEKIATGHFAKITKHLYSTPPVAGWPAACNWAWQSAARFIYEHRRSSPWLFNEADAIPLKPGWFSTLKKAYMEGGKPFGGHVVVDMGHMNGVGIYPGDVLARSEQAMISRATAWDVVLKPAILNNITPLNSLIQHAWNVRPDGMIWNGEGVPLSFGNQADVDRWMDFGAVLLHRQKDHTLIPFLRERRNEERRRIEEEKERIKSTEFNVPRHTTRYDIATRTLTMLPATMAGVLDRNDAEKTEVPEKHGRLYPKTEILIVTYWKDGPWLEYSLKCLQRFVSGFSGITVAFPRKDFGNLIGMIKEAGARPWVYDEIRGKGMIQHMAIMGTADDVVPKGTEFVCHLDADCMYHTPTTPKDYFEGGKPVYLFRTWDSLIHDPRGGAQQVVSDCYQWFEPTRQQLGFEPEVYTMCRHPTVFPIGFYANYRRHIESVHNQSFMDYMLSGRNEFPQTRMDWTAMGAWAYRHMRDAFHWIDVVTSVPPVDRQKPYWSHGGLKPDTKQEIESFLMLPASSRYKPTEEELERMAQ